jgi:hypothetical protein
MPLPSEKATVGGVRDQRRVSIEDAILRWCEGEGEVAPIDTPQVIAVELTTRCESEVAKGVVSLTDAVRSC